MHALACVTTGVLAHFIPGVFALRGRVHTLHPGILPYASTRRIRAQQAPPQTRMRQSSVECMLPSPASGQEASCFPTCFLRAPTSDPPPPTSRPARHIVTPCRLHGTTARDRQAGGNELGNSLDHRVRTSGCNSSVGLSGTAATLSNRFAAFVPGCWSQEVMSALSCELHDAISCLA